MAIKRRAKRKKKKVTSGKRYPDTLKLQAQKLAAKMSKTDIAKKLKIPISAIRLWTKGITSNGNSIQNGKRWGIAAKLVGEIATIEKQLKGYDKLKKSYDNKRAHLGRILSESNA